MGEEKVPDELQDILSRFEFGESYFCLEEIRIQIGEKPSCGATLAIGLPSKLNDVIFGKTSDFNGLIKTYDKSKLKKKLNDKSGKRDDNLPI